MKQPYQIIVSLLTALCLTLTIFAAEPEKPDRTLGESAADPSLGESASTLGDSGMVSTAGVLFPTEFEFIIDPFELSERGQVYSEPIRVVNTNDFPVAIGMSGLSAIAADSAVHLSQFPITPGAVSPNKDICLALRSVSGHGFDGEITLGASEQSVGFTLGASDEAVFEITGSINTSPSEPWEAGDIRLNLSFVALAPPDYALDPDDDGRIPEKEEIVFDDE